MRAAYAQKIQDKYGYLIAPVRCDSDDLPVYLGEIVQLVLVGDNGGFLCDAVVCGDASAADFEKQLSDFGMTAHARLSDSVLYLKVRVE